MTNSQPDPITGQDIKRLNEFNFKEWGVNNEIHLALVIEALTDL